MNMDTIILDGQSLTIDQVVAVANGQPGAPRVVLSHKAQTLVRRAAKAVAQLLEQGEVASPALALSRIALFHPIR